MSFIIIKYTKVNLFEKLKLKNKNFYIFLYNVDVQSRCAHPTLYKKTHRFINQSYDSTVFF